MTPHSSTAVECRHVDSVLLQHTHTNMFLNGQQRRHRANRTCVLSKTSGRRSTIRANAADTAAVSITDTQASPAATKYSSCFLLRWLRPHMCVCVFVSGGETLWYRLELEFNRQPPPHAEHTTLIGPAAMKLDVTTAEMLSIFFLLFWLDYFYAYFYKVE